MEKPIIRYSFSKISRTVPEGCIAANWTFFPDPLFPDRSFSVFLTDSNHSISIRRLHPVYPDIVIHRNPDLLP